MASTSGIATMSWQFFQQLLHLTPNVIAFIFSINTLNAYGRIGSFRDGRPEGGSPKLNGVF